MEKERLYGSNPFPGLEVGHTTGMSSITANNNLNDISRDDGQYS